MTLRALNVLTATFFILAAAGPLAAQDPGEQLLPETDETNTRVGTRGGNFLEIGIGARAMALAGAFAAMTDGVSALYWNPAGIAKEPRFAAMFSYNNMYGDFGVDHFFGGVTLPIGEGAAGVSINALSSGDILRTTERFPEGGDPQFGDSFSWNSVAIGLTYGRQITDRLVVGATLKVVQTGIDDAKASGFGGDAGVQFRTGLLGATLGASVLNLGSDLRFKGTLIERIVASETDGGLGVFPTETTLPIELKTEGWDMPTRFAFSVLWDLVGSPDAVFAPNPDHALLLVTDAVDAIDTDIQARIGVEYGYRELFFIRGGKSFVNEDDSGDFRDFSYGLGVGFGIAIPLGESRLVFDYAYTDRGLLDQIQVFTFEFSR